MFCSTVRPRKMDKALRRSAPEDHPIVNDIRPVGNPQRLPDVVVGDEDADPAGFEVKDDFLDVRDGDRIDAGKGLVEEDEFRGDY